MGLLQYRAVVFIGVAVEDIEPKRHSNVKPVGRNEVLMTIRVAVLD
jgi:hypothetical protein